MKTMTRIFFCCTYCILMTVLTIPQYVIGMQNQSVDNIDKKNYETVVREYLRLGEQEKAIELLKNIALTGNVEAQYFLAVVYAIDENNSKLAAEWFEKAAKQDHVDAQTVLGSLYLEGKGVKKNKREALKWLYKAANNNSVLAHGMIGREYYIDRKYKQAFEWFKMAADRGEVVSQYHLGIMYFQGLGVEQNYQTAFKYFEEAALAGEELAQLELGIMYAKGESVVPDYEKAVYWMQKAEEQGVVEAQFKLGLFYNEAVLGARSKDKAIYWLTKASENGHKQAEVILHKIYDGSCKSVMATHFIQGIKRKLFENTLSDPSLANEVASVDVVSLTANEARLHEDPEIQSLTTRGDLSFSKNLLFLKNFPNTKVFVSFKRMTRDGYSKIDELIISDNGKLFLSKHSEKTYPCYMISARGFLPGEIIKVLFVTEDKKFQKQVNIIPNPLIASNESKTAFIVAEMVSPEDAAFYTLYFFGFSDYEEVQFSSVSGDEKINHRYTIPSPDQQGGYIYSPGILATKGGEGKVTITRKSGEKITLSIPWGTEFKKWVEGAK